MIGLRIDTPVLHSAGAVCQPAADYANGADIDWTAVVSDLRPHLLHVATSILGDGHDAEDAAQEALLRAWTSVHRLRDARALPAWIGTIARRVAIDRLRRTVRERDLARDRFDERLHVPHASARREPRPSAVAELRSATQQLSPALRSVVHLTAQGLDLREIAVHDRTTYGAAKTRMSRARSAIVSSLG